MKSKTQTYVITFLLSVFFTLVSTPWEFGLTFFGDSKGAWILHYLIGFILCFYVTYVFIRAIMMLVDHSCEYFKQLNQRGQS